jgi:hypothetical protein
MFVMDLALALDMGYYAGSTEADGTDGAIWEGEKKECPGCARGGLRGGQVSMMEREKPISTIGVSFRTDSKKGHTCCM